MKTVGIKKAQPITHNEPVKSVVIVIDEEVNTSPIRGTRDGLKEVEDMYAQQGKLLADTLVKALPQGTIEPLLVNLMQHRVSLYCGTMNIPKGT